MSTENLSKVVDVISKQLGKNPEDIKSTDRIVEELNADSLDVIEMLMTLEEEYGVSIPDDVASELKTVGSIAEYLSKQKQ